jgi:hypothetical protein
MQEVAMAFVSAGKIVGLVTLVAAGTLVLASTADAAKVRKSVRVAPVAAYASVAPATTCRGADLFPCGPLYFSGVYLGSDPDPFIRSQIWRDLSARFGGED